MCSSDLSDLERELIQNKIPYTFDGFAFTVGKISFRADAVVDWGLTVYVPNCMMGIQRFSQLDGVDFKNNCLNCYEKNGHVSSIPFNGVRF